MPNRKTNDSIVSCAYKAQMTRCPYLAADVLAIAERCGYVLQAADAHLELAQLALARGDRATARDHATHARRYATCDGPPDWTYKVAYEEAGALLAELGQ